MTPMNAPENPQPCGTMTNIPMDWDGNYKQTKVSPRLNCRCRSSLQRPWHLSWWVIFTLADSAFAFACNSRNQALSPSTTPSLYRTGQLGDTLRADAREVSLSGRSGIYDVTVTNQNVTIAEICG